MSPWLSDLLLRSQSDERLVILACQGNDRAFTAIVERYRGALLACARRIGNGERAEDTVQQTFLKAFAAIRAGTEVRHLRGWLHQILRSSAIDQAAAAPPAAALGDPPSLDTVEDRVEHTLLLQSTFEHLARLPTRQRDALIRTAIDGRSREEIASSMGLSEGAVRQLVHRARASLRTAVTAITPLPLARWLSAPRSHVPTESLAETAASVGTASGAGAILKIGTVLASGVVAAGVVAGHSGRQHGAGRADRQGGATAQRIVAATPLAEGVQGSVSTRTSGLSGAGSERASHGGGDRMAGRSAGRDGRSTDGGSSGRRGQGTGDSGSGNSNASSGSDHGGGGSGATAGTSGSSSRDGGGGDGGGGREGSGSSPQPSSSSGSDGSHDGSSGGPDAPPLSTTGLVEATGADGSSSTGTGSGSTASSSGDGGSSDGGTPSPDGSTSGGG